MRIVALVNRIIQQMLRDKRTLALLFLAPLLILSLMYFIFHTEDHSPKLGIVGGNTKIIKALENANIEVEKYNQLSQEEALAKDLDGWLTLENKQLTLTLQNDSPSKAKTLQMQVKQALTTLQMNSMSSKIPTLGVTTNYVYGDEDTQLFDIISPILVGFFVFFFVFLIAGIALLKERTTGTLERLLATPIRRHEVVLGYLIGYGIFAVIQTSIVVLYAVKILDIVLVGSIWYVLLINLLLALVALSLGILLSSFASSEFQMVQFIPLVIVPQIFFTGLFPLDGMADWLLSIGKIMPLYYAADALTGVMYKGFAFADIVIDLGVLLLFSVLFIFLNIIALKKYRAI
ncbi:ABC transporter permease [Viridibacillus sp. FSL R5-0477]|uniref:ABC transporter permease n=1 Tax=Viridibacillus arenosi FSL R5-213 TaxID=1227360 RepID=W4F5X5_9BACL|nr:MULTISPECIES: ABC transporter permease [Viridibacillus]ETT87777.1 ABC transporter permease [Viridibacillus arenosi FSL R5-213]OMC81773.1 ABC transporter permease [Viridibacillus sp. FSL H8-0123]OMC89063.1 ABC transporter permease [Viridibacillus sp. FSL H7-0596]OMC89795.1 ABC transporter permease [Viridibacillus arenosi]